MKDTRTNEISSDARLKKAGLRRTPVRLGVLDLLAASRQSLDVTEILAKLPTHTDAVTVYRTLNAFTRKKMVHRIRGENRSWRYALGDSQESKQHRHPHFVCEDCGKVECLVEAEIPSNFIRSLAVCERGCRPPRRTL